MKRKVIPSTADWLEVSVYPHVFLKLAPEFSSE